jgi:hypothetical protein
MTPRYANLGIDLLLDADGDLVVSPTGDLAVTPDGRTTLLQDVRDLLDTLPGDLFGHLAYGAGVGRLFGEEDRPDFDALLTRAIADSLTYDPSVAPRLEPDSIRVTRKTGTEPREPAYEVSFVPLGEAWTNKLNLVFGAGSFKQLPGRI